MATYSYSRYMIIKLANKRCYEMEITKDNNELAQAVHNYCQPHLKTHWFMEIPPPEYIAILVMEMNEYCPMENYLKRKKLTRMVANEKENEDWLEILKQEISKRKPREADKRKKANCN